LIEEDTYVGLLGDKKGTPDNLLDEKDSGVPESVGLSMKEGAQVPYYSLKRYLKGNNLVDVVFGTLRTRSTVLAGRYHRGDAGGCHG
jgi:hypothetical protein